MRQRTLAQFREYLDRLSDPKNEHQGKPVFWSRTVRDNARAMVDALLMEQEGVPADVVRVLTQSHDRPDGVDLERLHAAFPEKL